jgi:hypothetical protein
MSLYQSEKLEKIHKYDLRMAELLCNLDKQQKKSIQKHKQRKQQIVINAFKLKTSKK